MALSDAKVQIIIVGLAALCCPGLFNALNGLGKAGGAEPKYANQANASLYAFFAVFGYFGGAFFNLFGAKPLLCGGGLTYALYALGMYLASNYEKASWMAIFVGCVLGIGAGLFWTAQGAMMMAYSTAENRGSYISLFWIIFNCGGMLGGILQFAINWNSTSNQANAPSYFTFIALMASAAIGTLFFIVAPKKVKKADGSMVIFEEAQSWLEELKGAIKASLDKNMLLLAVLFLSSNWFYTYQFNFVNGSLFSTRTRGFNSAVYWGSQMLAAWILGFLMDKKEWSKRRRASVGWGFSLISFAVAWAAGCWLQYGFEGGYDKTNLPIELIDLADSSRCALPTIIYLLYGFADATIQAFAYWIMGAIAGNDATLSARFAGFYKGIQSAGAAVAWGIDLQDSVTYAIQYWIGFGAWALGMALAFLVVRNVPNDETDVALHKSISVLNSTGEGAVQRSSSLVSSKLAKSNSLRADKDVSAAV